MAMTAGSVTIADDGTPTKSGMAEAIYDSFVDNYSADVEAMTKVAGVTIPDGEHGVAIKRGYAVQATRMAAIVTYFTTNAGARIGAALGGLQLSTAIGNPTAAHGGADIDLPIV